MKRAMWPALGGLALAIAVTTAMDASGYSVFSALPLLPLAACFWFLQKLSRAQIGLTLGPSRVLRCGAGIPRPRPRHDRLCRVSVWGRRHEQCGLEQDPAQHGVDEFHGHTDGSANGRRVLSRLALGQHETRGPERQGGVDLVDAGVHRLAYFGDFVGHRLRHPRGRAANLPH